MPTFRRLIRAFAPAMLLAGAGGAFFCRAAPAAAAARPQLAAEVRARLAARLPDGGAGLRVQTQGGAILLTGTVDSPLRKAMAAEAAAGVPGVVRIVDALQVSPERRTDLAVVRDVRWALAHDPVTLGLDLTASVHQGLVRLEGVAATPSQKRLAAWILSDIRGVRGIDNRIRVSAPPRPDAEIRGELSRRYAASPLFDDGRVAATVRDGVVTLTGTVRSAIGKTWAEEDAWLPGVREVDAGGLAVAPEPTLSHVGGTPALNDEEIREAIVKGLEFDARVASTDAAVGVVRGHVTLTGAVPDLRAKRAAAEIARDTGGVTGVDDRLRVEPPTPRSDAALTEDLRTAFAESATLHAAPISSEVKNGRVDLKGAVRTAYAKWLAGALAARIAGVAAVTDDLTVSGPRIPVGSTYYYFPRGAANQPWIYAVGRRPPMRDDAALAAEVRRQIELGPYRGLGEIRVEASHGRVTLRGAVPGATARAFAVDAAYLAGAREVIDELGAAFSR